MAQRSDAGQFFIVRQTTLTVDFPLRMQAALPRAVMITTQRDLETLSGSVLTPGSGGQETFRHRRFHRPPEGR